MEPKAKLKFTVITVCRNAEATIEQTILDVLAQTYNNVEYVIVDGASTDNTLAIINKYRDRITTVISERDKNIFDAMNKGIMASTGDYGFFLNCGDLFISNHVIEKVSALISSYAKKPDIFYGNILVLDRINLWGYISGIDFVSDRTMFLDNIPHQAAFVSVPAMKKKLFDIQHRIGADFDWFVYAHKVKRYKFQFSDIIVTSFEPYGNSSDKTLGERTEERIRILLQYYSRWELIGLLLFNYLKLYKYPPVKRKYVRKILNHKARLLLGL